MADLTFTEETAVFYIRTESVPRSKHLPPRSFKISHLMLYNANVVVCSEIRAQHINAM